MDFNPTLPIPISLVGGKYLLFDIDVISWLRRNHHVCGVMGGTLPQSPSQNIFLGLPMQIMPEEAQFLIEKEVAYILDDPRAHNQAMRSDDSARHADYIAQIRRKAAATSKIRAVQRDEKRKKVLSKNMLKQSSQSPADQDSDSSKATTKDPNVPDSESDSFLFDSPPSRSDTPTPSSKPSVSQPYSALPTLQDMTPTTSNLLLPPSSLSSTQIQIPNLPSSYPLYRHLNQKSYFVTPGLRFGCQYCVYPGDPLRFHSHFLAVGFGWEEEIDLMDIVGGGRLGTGVKKGFLIGGSEPDSIGGTTGGNKNGNEDEDRIRTFSIEWAAM